MDIAQEERLWLNRESVLMIIQSILYLIFLRLGLIDIFSNFQQQLSPFIQLFTVGCFVVYLIAFVQ